MPRHCTPSRCGDERDDVEDRADRHRYARHSDRRVSRHQRPRADGEERPAEDGAEHGEISAERTAAQFRAVTDDHVDARQRQRGPDPVQRADTVLPEHCGEERDGDGRRGEHQRAVGDARLREAGDEQVLVEEVPDDAEAEQAQPVPAGDRRGRVEDARDGVVACTVGRGVSLAGRDARSGAGRR